MDLLHEDSATGFQYRREVVTRLLLANYDQGTRRNDTRYWADLLVLSCHNRTLPPAQLAALALEVRTSPKADFMLASAVRILHCQPALNQSVLGEALFSLQGLWFTAGDTRSVFHSENHILLWSSAAPVLCRLGWAPPRCPAGWKKRTLAYLREKQAVGFYEFASGVYSPWTLFGLVNLYDLTDERETEIRALAAGCVQALVRQLRQYSNEVGMWPVPQMRYQGPPEALSWNLVLLSGPRRDLYGDFAGVWDGSARNFSLYQSTAFVLLLTELDLFGGVAGEPRLLQLDEQFIIGRPADEQRRALENFSTGLEEKPLDEWDLTAMGWSMGAYVGPTTSEHTFRLLQHWQLWDNHQFVWAKFWRDWSSHLVTNDAGWLLREVTGSSLLHAICRLWRYGNSSLGSFQRYHPGFRGWQQRPLSAGLGHTELWLASGKLARGGRLVTRHGSGSNNLPFVNQSQHVALVAFRRSVDVALTEHLQHSGVQLVVATARGHEEPERYCVKDSKGHRWFLFREPKTSAYAAVLTPCGKEICAGSGRGHAQVWALVVGHPDLHGDFSNFSQNIASSNVSWKWRGRTLLANAQVSGQSLELRWQAHDGPILQTTIGLSVYLVVFPVLLGLLCWCCCVMWEVRPSEFCAPCDSGWGYRSLSNGHRRRACCVSYNQHNKRRRACCLCCKKNRECVRSCLRHRKTKNLRKLITLTKLALVVLLIWPFFMVFGWFISLDHAGNGDPGL